MEELLIPDPLRIYRQMKTQLPDEAAICRRLAVRADATDALTAAREMFAPEMLTKDRAIPDPDSELARLRDRFDELYEQLLATADERDRARAELDQANRDLEHARRHRDDARGRWRAAEDDVAQLRQRATSAEARYAMTQDALRRWMSSYEEQKSRAEAARAEAAQLREDLAWSQCLARGWANLRPVRWVWTRWYRWRAHRAETTAARAEIAPEETR